ncbi:uncharacterized protein LOC100906443 [Galendromus occidentalis]|uniref:Uncharacterized protein LOC100906443 n=1 Tax=Galendromus occidentalis TaxID=34638 RepID=A0AAJ6VXD0_9ACAR|nr:uncharacterized protein LOC100906443 [Galendromus occidentalis]
MNPESDSRISQRRVIEPPDGLTLFLMEHSEDDWDGLETSPSFHDGEEDDPNSTGQFDDSTSRGASLRRPVQPPFELRSTLRDEAEGEGLKRANNFGWNFLTAFMWSLSRVKIS